MLLSISNERLSEKPRCEVLTSYYQGLKKKNPDNPCLLCAYATATCKEALSRGLCPYRITYLDS